MTFPDLQTSNRSGRPEIPSIFDAIAQAGATQPCAHFVLFKMLSLASSIVQAAMDLDSIQTDETYEAAQKSAMNRPAPRLATGPMSESNLAGRPEPSLVPWQRTGG
jgi:hypothetical protein